MYVAPESLAAAHRVAQAVYAEKVPEAAAAGPGAAQQVDRCPACGTRLPEQAESCPDCGLAFVALDDPTGTGSG